MILMGRDLHWSFGPYSLAADSRSLLHLRIDRKNRIDRKLADV